MRSWFWLLMSVLVALLACGDDDDSAQGADSGGKGAHPSERDGGPAGGDDAGGRGGAGGKGQAGGGRAGASGGGADMQGASGAGASGGTGATGGGASGSAGDASGAGGAAGSMGPDPTLIDESSELYDQERVPRFDIALSETSIAMLRADGETYVPGDLSYGDELVSNIGVRIKGEGSRRTLDEKTALKLKFDEFVPGQTFHGLRRLVLNNMIEDPSFLAERLAFELYRAAKLPAPRCNSALLYINGEAYGVYANVEAEDKTFLRRWFNDEDGNLYEEGHADFVPGAELEFDLETNETANDRSDLRNLIEVFQAASPSSLVSALNPVLDVPHFLRFTAAEAAVNQWDMYGYTVYHPNNFRLYHDPTSNRFVFLPWGMDMSMKPYPETGRRHIAIYELALAGDRPDSPVTAGLIFQRCLESQECRDQYSDAVREIVALYESLDLETKAARYHDQILELVIADPRTAFNQDQFEAGYQDLLSTIRERPAAILAELEP